MLSPLIPSRIAILEVSAARARATVFDRWGGAVRQVATHDSVVPSAVGDALAGHVAALELLPRAVRSGTLAVVLLPHELVAWRTVRLPRVDRRQREKLLRFEATRDLPWPAEQVEWMSVAGNTGLDDPVVLAAVERATVERLCAAATERGYDPVAAVPTGIALRSYLRQANTEANQAALCVEFSRHTIAITQTAGRDQWAIRTVRLRAGQVDARGETPDRAAATEFLVAEVIRSQRHFEAERNFPRPGSLLLAGAVPESGNVLAALRERLVAEFQLSPAAITVLPPDAATLGAARWSEASAGLLPTPRVSVREAAVRRRRHAVSLACTAASLVVVGAQWAHAARVLNAKSVDLERALAPVAQRERRIAAQRQLLARLDQEDSARREFTRRRRGWLRLVGGLETALRESEPAWIDTMKPAPDAAAGELRIGLGGWVADVIAPSDAADAGTFNRARTLFARLAGCPGVVRLERERLDWQGGLLRFECEMVVSASVL